MEEKERYEILYFDNDTSWKIIDNKTKKEVGGIDDMIKLLNQQDKRIKELEEENNFLKKRNEELTIDRRDLCLERNDIFEENQQLKQQLHDLPKKIVGEIKKELYDCGKTYLEDEPYIEICIVKGILDTILEKYGWKENGKSNM